MLASAPKMLSTEVRKIGARLVLVLVPLTSLACTAVYPEVQTPVRPPPAGANLSPAAPDDLFFIRVSGATIPEMTRDGRKWDAVGGSAPDPFVKITANDKEIARTPTQENTLTPTWPDAVRANYRIPHGTVVKVELWDANPINNHPICVRVLRAFREEARSGVIDIDCESGAKISLIAEPAHARVGLGMRYEFRTQSVHVTRVALESPAGRIGLRGGEEITRIQGKEVKTLDELETRSLINANADSGLSLTVKKADGSTQDVSLRSGPIYPVLDDDIPLE